MAEPTTTGSISLTVLFIALLGPLAGPYALIVFASLAGALWPLSAQVTATHAEGAWLLLRCTLTAIVMTVFFAGVLERAWGVPINEGLGAVALLIGALGNGWRPVFNSLSAGLTALAGKVGGNSNG